MECVQLCSVFGYGSLMECFSAQKTMPSASNFRCGKLDDYIRMYNLVSISGIRSGNANLTTNEIAALSIKPNNNSFVLGVLFDLPLNQLDGYLEREHRYKPIQTTVWDFELETNVVAWTVVAQTDEEYLSNRCSNNSDEYFKRVKQYYEGLLWGRTDILPMPIYCFTCLKAAYVLGGLQYLDNMLDNTLLSDNTTSLRSYLRHLLRNKESNNYKNILETCCEFDLNVHNVIIGILTAE